jgi:hypothetical protein
MAAAEGNRQMPVKWIVAHEVTEAWMKAVEVVAVIGVVMPPVSREVQINGKYRGVAEAVFVC